MDVFLDNNELATPEQTLGAILSAARKLIAPAGRFVVEVRVDGRTLEDSEIEFLGPQKINAEEIQLITADPLELADQALADIGDSLRRARGAQQEAAQLLRTDRPADALRFVQDALGVWSQAQQAVQSSARLLEINLDQLRVGDESVPRAIQGLLDRLAAVRTQLTASDWLGLADTLAYELDASALTWTQLMADIRSRVQKARTVAR
jgi:hypothetical protein